MRPNGSHQRLLVRAHGVGGCSADKPRWSPDGKHIVYTGTGPLTAAPFVRIADADGSQNHLVPNTAYAESASFSPDGRYIVFFEVPPDAQTYSPRIYVIRPNGTGLRRITPRRQRAANPSWSPDGTRIIYSCSFHPPTGGHHPVPAPRQHVAVAERLGFRAICEISRTNPKLRILFSVPAGYVGDPAWSADGKKILFPIYDPNGSSGLALMSASGGGPVVIANSGEASDPDW
jgi:Tol biopolymer transport system component